MDAGLSTRVSTTPSSVPETVRGRTPSGPNRNTPAAPLGIGFVPPASVPMKLLWMKLVDPVTKTPLEALPEMTFRPPWSPMRLSAPETDTPVPLGTAALPAASSPM